MSSNISSEPSRARSPRVGSLRAYHVLVATLSLGLTLGAWRVSSRQQKEKARLQFDREADHVVELVVERMRKYENGLRGGVGAIQALGGDVTYEQWLRFARALGIERRYPGVGGIGVIHYVSAERLPEYLTRQRESRPGYEVHPSEERGEYWPITYIEPAASNREAVGLDMAHEHIRFSAARAARDTGKPQATGSIVLVQDSGRTPGFLFFVPFYRGGEPSSPAARRQRFVGLVYAPFVFKNLLDGTLSKSGRHLDIRLEDIRLEDVRLEETRLQDTRVEGVLPGRPPEQGPRALASGSGAAAAGSVLYDEHVPSEGDFDAEPLYERSVDVEMYGRIWRFTLRTTLGFRAAVHNAQPLTILCAGLFIDLLLAGFLVVSARANARALTANDQLASHLGELETTQRRLEQAREALQASEEHTRGQWRAALNIAADAKKARDEATAKERLASLALDSAPNALVMVGADERITLLSAQAERLFGHSREELLGKPVAVLIPERMRAGHPLSEQLECIRPRTRAAANRETLVVRSDGSELPVEIVLNRVETAHGPQRLAAMVDITSRTEAARFFELAVESAPNAMVMIDATGTIVMVNEETERMFGYDREELVSQSVDILVPERFRERHGVQRGGFFGHPQVRSMGAGRDLYAVRKGGSEFPVEIGLNPIATGKGRFVLSAVVDITERKRAADALSIRNEEMEQLLYTVSHDLKSPLVTIQGFSSLIDDALAREDTEDARDSARRVARATKTMGTLIDDLLELSRVGREDEPAWVDVAELVQETHEQLHAQFSSAGARLDVVTPLPAIFAMPKPMRQILLNLMGNAVKYGCQQPGDRVEIGCEESPRHHRFFVRDFGPGIAAQHHERVFVIFRRLPSKKEGTGLGLAIVKKAARSMGGDAWVESPAGGGSTFWFSVGKHFPVAKSSHPPTLEVSHA